LESGLSYAILRSQLLILSGVRRCIHSTAAVPLDAETHVRHLKIIY
jgi:hypothetical protein